MATQRCAWSPVERPAVDEAEFSGQHCEGLGQRFLRCSSESALSDNDSKRAFFPMMSRGFARASSRVSRAISARSAVSLPTFFRPLFARQHPGVALLAPFADQRRIQALPPQIGAAFTVFARLLIGMQMGNLVEASSRCRCPHCADACVASSALGNR